MQGGQVWLAAIRFGIFFVVLMLGCQDSTTQLRIPGWVFFIFFWFRTMSVLIMSDSLPMPLAVAISCLISLIYLWYLYDFGDDKIQFLKTWPGSLVSDRFSGCQAAIKVSVAGMAKPESAKPSAIMDKTKSLTAQVAATPDGKTSESAWNCHQCPSIDLNQTSNRLHVRCY